MMRVFRKEMIELLASMEEEDKGILIMIDGDHFKQVNNNWGYSVVDRSLYQAKETYNWGFAVGGSSGKNI